jgi:hypothetical protein
MTFFRLPYICSSVLIFIFFYSGLQKLIDFENFFSNISKSPIIPSNLSKLIAYFIIYFELVIVFFLLTNKYKQIGFLMSFFLLILFEGYIILMILYSPYLPCSCGGFIEQLSWTQHIYFNVFLIACSITGFMKNNSSQQIYL